MSRVLYWSELPRDVAIKILGLIPVGKELISLKLICKEWNFLISRVCIQQQSPPYPCAPCWGFLSFIDTVVPGERDKFYELEFSYLGDYIVQDIVRPHIPVPILNNIWSLVPNEDRKAAKILDCCNGMMLLASKSQFYVGNPVTKESFCVPINPNRSTIAIRSSLVFDPAEILSQDRDRFFNIVSFVRPPQEASVSHPMELDIYSSDTGGWCTHVVELEPHHLYGYDWIQRSVYFKGALYSLSLAMYLVCIDNIVPTPKRARAIALPDKDDDDEVSPDTTHCGCIGYSSGRFLYSNRDEKHSRILVWMLENSSQWVLMHSISIRQDIGHTLNLLSATRMERYKWSTSFRTRVFHPKDHGTATFYMGSPEFFLAYDTIKKETSVHCVPIMPNTKIRVDGNWIFPFSPCLLLLKPNT